MSTYCNLINFPKEIKDILINDKNIIELKLDSPTYGVEFVLPNKFPKEFNIWLGDMFNLRVDVSEIFYLQPNAMHPIHSDGKFYPNEKGKLNFIIGGKGSKMYWYKPLKPEKFLQRRWAQENLPAGYLHIPPSEALELHSAPLTDFCIVDAGTFHTVINADELRIAWNLVLADCKTNHRLLLTELQERLSEYVVD